MDEFNNEVFLRGTLAGAPVFSHRGKTEEFFTFPLEIMRLSGTSDKINIIAGKALMDTVEITDGDFVEISGELRSYNKKSGKGSRLVITIFAKSIAIIQGDYANSVTIKGILCKQPNLRKTPMGRQICDMMVAVNRKYGRSDYLPCIAWGQTVAETSEMNVGDNITITGWIQSRNYIKNKDGVAMEKTAFELSAVTVTK